MDSYALALHHLGARARSLRILRGLQQAEVAERAALSPGTVKRFEHTGRASIENVLRIATVLGADGDFDTLFAPPRYRTLDDVLVTQASEQRQRVRKPR